MKPSRTEMCKPRVGVGVILPRDDKVLLGKRKGSHGAGTWSFPGGHLEPGESFEDCCRRETLEETGIKVGKLIPVGFTNDIFEEEKLHYVTLYFMSENFEGEPELMEPDKCEEWGWYALDLIPGESMLLNSMKTLDNRHLFMALTGPKGMICIPVSTHRGGLLATMGGAREFNPDAPKRENVKRNLNDYGNLDRTDSPVG